MDVWVTPTGKKAHTRIDCPTIARSRWTGYQYCRVCYSMGDESGGENRAPESESIGQNRAREESEGSGQHRARAGSESSG